MSTETVTGDTALAAPRPRAKRSARGEQVLDVLIRSIVPVALALLLLSLLLVLEATPVGPLLYPLF